VSSEQDSGFAARVSAVAAGRSPEGSVSATAPTVRLQRYRVRDVDGGQRLIECADAPGLSVRVERGLALSEADFRRLGERVIVLDGAARFGPLLDNDRQLYNLDHHEGCVRAFTLSTCEQALVMVVKGLELHRADWTIIANEPDLDTVFAIWVLLNHRRIRELDAAERDVLLPLIRLEGAIDANGPEVAEFCGLPQETLREARAALDALFERERRARAGGEAIDYAVQVLDEIDELVFGPHGLLDLEHVEEVYGHVDVGDGRVAVVCRDRSGIYEVEKRLKKIWGERLGVIALENAPGRYTLRRTSSLARVRLEHAYAWLNALDPAVDGRPPDERWGGSDDIGGSPRAEGSRLAPRELLEVLGLAFDPPPLSTALWRGLGAGLLGLGLLALAGTASAVGAEWLIGRARLLGLSLVADHAQLILLGLGLFALSALASCALAARHPWLHGWRLPAEGTLGLRLGLPVAAVGALGGLWVPEIGPAGAHAAVGRAAALLCAALGAEACFRGVVHGLLVRSAPVQWIEGPWRLSRATWVSALAWVAATLIVATWWIEVPAFLPWPPWVRAWWVVAGASLLAGLGLGVLRERTLSLWPGVAAHALGAAAALALRLWQ
jgi:hypothetical protein